MGSGHSHAPAGHAGGRHRWRLSVSFGLIVAFFVVELTYGLISGSLAVRRAGSPGGTPSHSAVAGAR